MPPMIVVVFHVVTIILIQIWVRIAARRAFEIAVRRRMRNVSGNRRNLFFSHLASRNAGWSQFTRSFFQACFTTTLTNCGCVALRTMRRSVA
jgi:hypothetical protein